VDGDLRRGAFSFRGGVSEEDAGTGDVAVSTSSSISWGWGFRAIEVKLHSGIRFLAALPYVAIFLRGGALS
jgi:hypothetical protein